MEKCTGLTDVLPPLLDRLHALKDLHQRAATFAESLDHLSTEQDKMHDMLKHTREVLERLERSVQQNQSVVDANVDVLVKRVDGLVGK